MGNKMKETTVHQRCGQKKFFFFFLNNLILFPIKDKITVNMHRGRTNQRIEKKGTREEKGRIKKMQERGPSNFSNLYLQKEEIITKTTLATMEATT